MLKSKEIKENIDLKVSYYVATVQSISFIFTHILIKYLKFPEKVINNLALDI